MASSTEAAIWERVIHPEGELTADAARAILKLKFNPEDRARMHELAQRAQDGNLTPDEQALIEDYERVGTLLSILKSRARKVLKRTPGDQPPAARTAPCGVDRRRSLPDRMS